MPPPTILRSTIGSVPLDPARAQRICWGILRGTRGKRGHFRFLFAAFPEVGIEDVHQEMLLSICRNWCAYDPGQSQPQTFMHQRASSAMIDLHRRCKAGKEKVKRRASQLTAEDFFHYDQDLADSDRPMTEMLAGNLKVAKRLFSKRCYRRGRRGFTMPQLMAIAILMRQLKIRSVRCHRTFQERPELLGALKLKRVPCERWLREARARLERFEEQITPKPEKPAQIGRTVPQADSSRNPGMPEKPADMRRCLPPQRITHALPGLLRTTSVA